MAKPNGRGGGRGSSGEEGEENSDEAGASKVKETKTVTFDDDVYEVRLHANGTVTHTKVEDREAVFISRSGSELLLSDFNHAGVEATSNGSHSFVVYFNAEHLHPDSPNEGNSISGEYDRNWYFSTMRGAE